jgi:non-ribosomal peptide synthetase component F
VSAVIADEPGLAMLAALPVAGLELPVLAPEAADDGTLSRSPLDGHRLDAPVRMRDSDTAHVPFTSGSIGRPKGMQITHGMTQQYFMLADRGYDFTSDDVLSQTFGLNSACGMFGMFCVWSAVASVHSIPADAHRDLPEFFTERKVTVWFSALSAIALARRMYGLIPGGMPTLRWRLFAGEALWAADDVEWHAAAGASTVENTYSPTKLTLTITGHRWSPEHLPGVCVNGLVPIGTMHQRHDHLLLTPEGELSDHEKELCVTGLQMTPGYLDRADNPGRFREHDRSTWYRTGDRVRGLHNDELIYLGRRQSQVQANGWRVELAEIEFALAGCPGVKDAVAVAPTANDTVDFAVFYTGELVPAARLARQLTETLPNGMGPRRYTYLAGFPLNFNQESTGFGWSMTSNCSAEGSRIEGPIEASRGSCLPPCCAIGPKWQAEADCGGTS